MKEADRILIGWAQGTDARRRKWARDRLTKRHGGLVWMMARKYAGVTAGRHTIEDLVQLGFEGLLKGIDRFDLSKKVEFTTYAVHWVRHAVARMTLPCKPHDMKTLVAARRAMARGVPEADLPETLGVPERVVRRALQAASTHTSLDRPVILGEEVATIGALIPDPKAVNAESALENESTLAVLRRAMATLETRQRRILELRFGFDDDRERTLLEVGKTITASRAFERGRPISRERVRQLEAEALATLRAAMAKETACEM